MITLEVQERGGDAADVVRGRGLVPAILYGRKEEATPLAIDARGLERVWKEAGQSSVVTLRGVGEQKETLIKEIQVHPVSGKLVHADFYALEKGKKVKINVPLSFVGEAPAEKAGHIVVKALHQIEIEAAPQDLPHTLPVDISKLTEVGDHILASDIPLPPSASLITHGDDTIVSVRAFVEEKEQEPTAPTPGAAEGTTPAAGGEAEHEKGAEAPSA